MWEHLTNHFQGDFDNYRQVLADRAAGMLPREGGGHENFHCTLVPVTPPPRRRTSLRGAGRRAGRLAAFYFDGNPGRIFRFRYYELREEGRGGEDEDGAVVEMRLYTLRPELEARLRACADVPSRWSTTFAEFGGSARDRVALLPGCSIAWSAAADPVQHSYTETIDGDIGEGVHAVMVHGEAVVESTMLPGTKIRILDQLSLYNDTFYINDRGFDPDSGAYVYGNQRGVPYRMERVASLADGARGGERVVVDGELAWTLGEAWRSAAEYEAKLGAAGGPSAGMRRPPAPSAS